MEKPYIDASENLPELTFKAILLSIVLAVVLAASNAYLGLKVGLIVSASIPAAMIAMVLFRFSKTSNILENNVVQTGASASASIAAGIVFVIPALLIVGYWDNINYWETVFICLSGGILGVLFSIPLRRALLSHKELRFPEGRAIAEVLKVGEQSASLKDLFFGGLIGALVQLSQQGLQVMSSTLSLWFTKGSNIFGLSLGFDMAMLGAGYIIGFGVGFSMFIGAIIGWVIGAPTLFHLFAWNIHNFKDPGAAVMALWSSKIRYLGIGAMLAGGIWSLISCIKPIAKSLKVSFSAAKGSSVSKNSISRTDYDIPGKYVLSSVIFLLAMITIYLIHEMRIINLELSTTAYYTFIITTVLYFFFAGFVFSAICAYFSGLVGVSASPVSAINIAALILIAIILDGILNLDGANLSHGAILHAAALTIVITAIVACAAALANNCIQDLKTGEIIGATPWKLEIMLIIGTVVSTLIIPPVVELLYNAYGMAGVFPAGLTDHSQMLGAPQASLIAAVAQGVFFHNLPFKLITAGAVISALFILANIYLKPRGKNVSVVAMATAIYLPMTVTMPIFFGSLIALFIDLKMKRNKSLKPNHATMMIACGLVAGGSIMGLLLSIPFAITGNLNVLEIVPKGFDTYGGIISVIVVFFICYWMYRKGIAQKT